MRHVAAYLLACIGGNDNPTASDIESILGSVGVEANKERLDHVLRELKGKNIEEIIAAGREKLATMGPTEQQSNENEVTPSSSPVAEEPTQEVKDDTEESDEDLGFGLFD